MSRIVNRIFSGLSNLRGVFNPAKKLTEEQTKLIPYRDFAQSLLNAKGISKKDVMVEICHPFKPDETAITFVIKRPNYSGEKIRKQYSAIYETARKLSECIPVNPKTTFIIHEAGNEGYEFPPTKMEVNDRNELTFETLR